MSILIIIKNELAESFPYITKTKLTEILKANSGLEIFAILMDELDDSSPKNIINLFLECESIPKYVRVYEWASFIEKLIINEQNILLI